MIILTGYIVELSSLWLHQFSYLLCLFLVYLIALEVLRFSLSTFRHYSAPFSEREKQRVMHLSSGFPGWGTPGIPGGIAAFYIKVIQFSEPSGMIWKRSLYPGEIRKAMRQWETMAATQWRLKMSPILGQEEGPEDQEDPGTGAHPSSILADFPR